MNFSSSYDSHRNNPVTTTGQVRPVARSLSRILAFQMGVIALSIVSLLIGWATELPGDFLFSGAVVGVTLFVVATIVGAYPHLFDVRSFRIPGMYLVAYVLMVILPTPVIYARHPTVARDTYLLATMVSFVCTILGVVFVHLVHPVGVARIRRWLARPIPVARQTKALNVALLIICFLLLFLYVRQIGVLPIQQALLGGNSVLELAQARENALKLLQGRIVYIYELLRNVLFPYVTMLSLVIASLSTRRIWLVIAAVSIAGNLIMASATLEKSPLAASFIMFCYTWLLLRRKPLSLARLLMIGLVAFGFPAFIMLAIYQFDRELQVVVGALLERLFVVPADVLYFHFEYFPAQHAHLLGRTLPFLSKLMPGGPFPITNVVCWYMHPDVLIASCSANAAYPGALWADFGWAGVLAGSFLVGGTLQALQILTQVLPKSGPTVVLQAFLAFQAIFLTSAALPDIIFSNGMGYATALTLALLLMQWRNRTLDRRMEFKPQGASCGLPS